MNVWSAVCIVSFTSYARCCLTFRATLVVTPPNIIIHYFQANRTAYGLSEQIFELLQGYLLFIAKPSEKGSWAAEDSLLASMIELLGPIPTDMLSRGTKPSDYFDAEGMFTSPMPPSFVCRTFVCRMNYSSRGSPLALSTALTCHTFRWLCPFASFSLGRKRVLVRLFSFSRVDFNVPELATTYYVPHLCPQELTLFSSWVMQ